MASSIHPAKNSLKNRQSRKFSSARADVSLPSHAMSVVDQEQISTSSSCAASDLPKDDLCGEDFELENSDGGVATAKKPAWNVPSNGQEVGVVMGGESWPLPSESARPSPKSPLMYSAKSPTHLSAALSQELGLISLSSSNEVSTSNSAVTSSHQKSMKHGVLSSSDNSTESSSQPASVQQSTSASSRAGKSGGYGWENSRDAQNKDGRTQGHGSHQRQLRRNNSGPITRGDGGSHHNHRRDHGNRSFGSRDRVASRPFMGGTSVNAPFIPPPPPPPVAVRAFGPMVYTELPSPPVFYIPGHHPDSLRGMPMIPMYYPMVDPHLPWKIVNQIEYYFSSENLVKDTFLRKNMDAEGWVSIKLIAGFKKVMQLTDNVHLILDAIKASNIVEVQGDRVRRKNDWIKWVMPMSDLMNQSSG